MSKEKSVTMGVRLTADQRRSLDEISAKTGVEVGTIIRMATEALMRHYANCGNRLVLPIDFSELFDELSRQSARVAETPGEPPKK